MSIYAERARYVPVEKGFNIKRPPIEPQAFTAEMSRAFADDAPTGFIAARPRRRRSAPTMPRRRRSCWRATPAFAKASGSTTPLPPAARCGPSCAARERCGAAARRSSGARRTCSRCRAASPRPGRPSEDAVLWVATDEPTLAFAGRTARGRGARTDRGDALSGGRHRPRTAYALRPADGAGHARAAPCSWRRERTEGLGTCLPSMTLTLNAVRPGEAQRPHRHNAAAHRAGAARSQVRLDDRRQDVSLDAVRDAADAGRRRARSSQRARPMAP